MKILPFALPNHFSAHIQKKSSHLNEEIWFIFKDSQLLVYQDSMQIFPFTSLPLTRSLYMGVFKETHLHVGEVDASSEAPPGGMWVDLKMLYGKVDDALYALAGRAMQLTVWDKTHQFCGQCGNRTKERTHERAKECPVCHHLSFPRLSPAVMGLIQKGDEILLARSPHFPKGMFSALAGFVDPGETLEQCLKREIFEEVGLLVDEIQYFGSQSWPFPHSLMIAFTCHWISGEINIDPIEIEEAYWFKKEALPPLPSEVSIARALIESVLNR